MVILPAIDLKDGKCVRLVKGDFDTVHKVSDDPVQTAAAFRDAGAGFIHMVDLDGALSGERKNGAIVEMVAKSSGLKIELGGGLRSMADIDAADDLGVFRFVIGSAAVSDPGFVKKAAEKYGERIAVGIDSRGGFVKTHGWTEDTGLKVEDFVKSMADLGVGTFIFTDIDTDGMLSGPPIDKLKALRKSVDGRIIASGGVSCNEDLGNLRDIGMDGVIIGKAWYAGKIDLARAVREAGEQCWLKG